MADEHHTAGVGALRGEVNSFIDWMSSNGSSSSGTISAISALTLSTDISFVGLVLAFLPLISTGSPVIWLVAPAGIFIGGIGAVCFDKHELTYAGVGGG